MLARRRPQHRTHRTHRCSPTTAACPRSCLRMFPRRLCVHQHFCNCLLTPSTNACQVNVRWQNWIYLKINMENNHTSYNESLLLRSFTEHRDEVLMKFDEVCERWSFDYVLKTMISLEAFTNKHKLSSPCCWAVMWWSFDEVWWSLLFFTILHTNPTKKHRNSWHCGILACLIV